MVLHPAHPAQTETAFQLRERARRYEEQGMTALAEAARKQAARQDLKERKAKRR